MSMQVRIPEEKINSLVDLSRATTQTLTDTEVQDAFAVIVEVQRKYATMRNTSENLDALRDEVLTKLMERNVLATFDPVPMLTGEPPIVEIIGKIPGDPIHTDGFDHERQTYEVQTATKRNEEVLGQKEALPGKAKRRAERNKRKKR